MENKPDNHRLIYVARSARVVERDFGERLSRLIREGFEVHVLCGEDAGIEPLTARGVVCKPIPVLNLQNPAALLGAYFIIQAYFIENKPLLVHAFDGPLLWLGALAASAADVTAIVISVEEHLLDLPAQPSSGLRGSLTNLRKSLENAVRTPLDTAPDPIRERVQDVLRRLPAFRGPRAYRLLASMVDKYLVNNEYDLEQLQARDLVPPSKLEMIIGGRGADLRKFDVTAADYWTRDAAREALGLPNTWRDVVGFRGELNDARTSADLLACVEQIAQTHPTCGWLLVSDTSQVQGRSARQALRALQAQQRAGRVRILEPDAAHALGILDDPARFYAALDLLVSPLYRMGSPTTLMEAAAAKLAAIAYHLPTSEAAIEHGQTGMLLPAGEQAALIQEIRAALNDPHRTQAWGSRARSLALRHFSRQHIEDQVFRIYDTTLEMKLMP